MFPKGLRILGLKKISLVDTSNVQNYQIFELKNKLGIFKLFSEPNS